MRLYRHLAGAAGHERPWVVAAGRFDGLHLGHQRVLARLTEVAAAHQAETTLIIRRPEHGTPVLTPVRRQIELLAGVAIDNIVLASAGATDRTALAAALDARVLVTADATTSPSGRMRVEVIPAVDADGKRVSSAGVVAALAGGDMHAASRLLGRDHAVGGPVVHGHHRGAPLGIPTANIRVRGVHLPADGVYAVRARVDDRPLLGVANIGFNPTFGNASRSVETHLLDFSGDLYGRRLIVGFVARLRGEQRFAGIDALLAQIRLDIAAARRLFASHGD